MDSLLCSNAQAPATLRHLLAAEDDDERAHLVGGLVHGLGFDWLSHGTARLQPDGTATLQDAWHGIGARDWQHRYRTCGHARHDPRLNAALGSRLPVVWQLDTLARRATPCQQPFVEDLADTGMRSGVMLSLSAARPDERTVVCLLSHEPHDTLADDDAWLGQVITLGLCLRELEGTAAASACQAAVAAAAMAPGSARGRRDTAEAAGPAGRQGTAESAGALPCATEVAAAHRPAVSPTQRAILHDLARGLCDKQIAGRLQLSPHTVDYHMRQLRKRYGARNRVQLVQAAAEGEYRVAA